MDLLWFSLCLLRFIPVNNWILAAVDTDNTGRFLHFWILVDHKILKGHKMATMFPSITTFAK